MTKVSISNVSKSYGEGLGAVQALRDVSLEIEDGEFICVVGHSGCGKTTLLNILGGFIPQTSGDISVGGRPIQSTDHGIGVVFQEYALFPWLTAIRNVEFGLEMIGVGKGERRKRAQHYLDLVRLGHAANAYPHELSGGMRQRVAVARAIAYNPDLLLMDEPFGALDAQTRERLQTLIEKVWQETRKTIFYVTHNLSEAVYLADRIVVMRPGPGHIHEIVPVQLPRPRDHLTPEFVAVQRYIEESMKDDATDLEEELLYE